MNTCPLTNENIACDLPGPETEGNDNGTPIIAYCEQCSQIAFRCSSGHWNRRFRSLLYAMWRQTRKTGDLGYGICKSPAHGNTLTSAIRRFAGYQLWVRFLGD